MLLAQRTWDPVTGVAQTTQTLIDGQGARESRTFSVRTYSATELLPAAGILNVRLRENAKASATSRASTLSDDHAPRHRRDPLTRSELPEGKPALQLGLDRQLMRPPGP